MYLLKGDEDEVGRLLCQLVEDGDSLSLHRLEDTFTVRVVTQGGVRKYGVGRTLLLALLNCNGESTHRHCSGCGRDRRLHEFSTGDRFCLPCRKERARDRRARRRVA